MKKINDPFLISYPTLDLHGEDRVGALIKVKEFINDCKKLKKYDIIVIHGKGSGILKSVVHEFLHNNNNVISYKTDNQNDGMTIIKLKERN